MASPIETTGLGRDYNGFPALKGLDLSVDEGVCFGFLGPNGAGKTTTIKLLTNLLRPTRGQARIFGHDAHKEPRMALARVGVVVETPEFYGYLSPRETLAYAGKLRGMRSHDIAKRTEEVISVVKLSEWIDERIGKFSRGMKQRVALAQALLHDPDLAIFDEPTLGLDPRGRVEVRGIIKDLKGRGHTIFMSSHLLSEVQEVCDQVGLLDHGELLLTGRVADLSQGIDQKALQVSFLEPVSEDGISWLEGQPGVLSVRRETGGSLELKVEGEDRDLAALLEAMIGHGLGVTSFRPVGSLLEQLYMEQIQESDRL